MHAYLRRVLDFVHVHPDDRLAITAIAYARLTAGTFFARCPHQARPEFQKRPRPRGDFFLSR